MKDTCINWLAQRVAVIDSNSIALEFRDLLNPRTDQMLHRRTPNFFVQTSIRAVLLAKHTAQN